MACETICTFFYVFFQNPKKHDFLRFFELLHTFSRTVVSSLHLQLQGARMSCLGDHPRPSQTSTCYTSCGCVQTAGLSFSDYAWLFPATGILILVSPEFLPLHCKYRLRLWSATIHVILYMRYSSQIGGVILLCPAPMVEGIKRWCSSDICYLSICLSVCRVHRA